MISNALGGRYYRLGLREEYVFEEMLVRILFLTRVSFCRMGNNFLGSFFFAMSRSAEGCFFPNDWFI